MPETDAAAAALAGVTGTGGAGESHTQDEGTGGVAGKVDWKALGVPDELRPTVEKYNGVAALAKGYAELISKLGATVQIPGANSTAEERKAFYAKLGRPESQDGYELSTVQLPKGIERNASADADFRAMVHDLDLTKDQARRLHEVTMKRVADMVIAGRAAESRVTEEQENAQRKLWGTAFDANQKSVEQVIALAGDAFVAKMNGGLGKDPVIRAGFYEISKLFSPDTLVAGRVASREKPTSPPGMVFDITKSPELVKK